MTTEEEPKWEVARLIPVSGIRSAEEQERRATSALLAVLASVEEFGIAFSRPYGAPKGSLETFIEVPLELANGRTVRPDGLIRMTRGKKTWTALIEVKTGSSQLKRVQVEDYLEAAKERGFDCVITISNQIAKIPGQHPVEVDKRKIRTVNLHHLSWSRVLTEAILQKSHRGVADPDQAWILGELIRYMEHPNAGAMDFSDMGEHWVSVRDAVKHRTLRPTDKTAVEVAGKWEELVTFSALRLGRKLGADVQEVLTRKERNDIAVRIANILDSMVAEGTMSAAIRIPDTVDDVEMKADLRAQQIVVSVNVKAPQQGRSATRINWLLRQLKTSPATVRVESWGLRARSSMCDLLGNVRKRPELLNPSENREIVSFRISIAQPMGLKRSAGARSFIDSVLDALDDFYADVVQHLKEWQPPAPRLKKSEPPQVPSNASSTKGAEDPETPTPEVLISEPESGADKPSPPPIRTPAEEG